MSLRTDHEGPYFACGLAESRLQLRGAVRIGRRELRVGEFSGNRGGAVRSTSTVEAVPSGLAAGDSVFAVVSAGFGSGWGCVGAGASGCFSA